MSDRTYLVTGALGCIGAWVVERLLEKGDHPVVFDLGTEPRRIRDLLGPEALARVSFVQGDIANPAAWTTSSTSPACRCPSAARTP